MKLKLLFTFSFLTLMVLNLMAQNLIPTANSPSFEDGTGIGVGSSLNGGVWARQNNSGDGMLVQNVMYRDSLNPFAQDGKYYCKAVTPATGYTQGFHLQAVNSLVMNTILTEGKTYELSFFYQNSAGHTFGMALQTNDGATTSAQAQFNTAATTWTNAVFKFTAPAAMPANLRLKLQFGFNAGTTLLDNLVLTEVATNLLTVNPSFEETAGGDGPGSSLNGGTWGRINLTNDSVLIQNVIYRKMTNPTPQHLTGYAEAATPAKAVYNNHGVLQAVNAQNLTTTLPHGKTYTVTYYYQNTANHSFRVIVENASGIGSVGNKVITSTTAVTEWTKASFSFLMDTTTLTNGRLKIQFGANAGTTRLDNFTITEGGTVSSKDLQAENNKLRILQNPTASDIYFELDAPDGNYQAQLVNLLGQVVTTQDFNATGAKSIYGFKIQSTSSGSYLFRVSNGQNAFVKKVVIQ